jgi:hypothetical protein
MHAVAYYCVLSAVCGRTNSLTNENNKERKKIFIQKRLNVNYNFSVSGYRYRGPGFDSRRYQIF